MFPDAEEVQAQLVGEHGLVDDVPDDLRVRRRASCRVSGDVAKGVEAEFECRFHGLCSDGQI